MSASEATTTKPEPVQQPAHDPMITPHAILAKQATGLLDIMAIRISTLKNIRDKEVPANWFELLSQAETKTTSTGNSFEGTRVVIRSPMSDATIGLFSDLITVPFKFTSASWILRSENYSDVLVVGFTPEAKEGLVVIQDRGVWAVSSAEYVWLEVQGLDLVFSVSEDNNKLALDCLK
jgi:hypothetical protein